MEELLDCTGRSAIEHWKRSEAGWRLDSRCAAHYGLETGAIGLADDRSVAGGAIRGRQLNWWPEQSEGWEEALRLRRLDWHRRTGSGGGAAAVARRRREEETLRCRGRSAMMLEMMRALGGDALSAGAGDRWEAASDADSVCSAGLLRGAGRSLAGDALPAGAGDWGGARGRSTALEELAGRGFRRWEAEFGKRRRKDGSSLAAGDRWSFGGEERK